MNAIAQWLKEKNGNIIIPKTLDSQTFDSDGNSLAERLRGIDDTEVIQLPKVDPTLIISDLDYSTEEQLTGKRWIDGKPIYQRTYTNVIPIKDVNVVVDNVFTDKTLLNYVINFKGMDNNLTNFNNLSDTLHADNGVLYYYFFSSSTWSGFNNADITVLYTKTTDTASSPVAPPKVEAMHNYSTEEKVVGTWIDGTTAYERTFTLDNPTNELVLAENVNHLITQTGHWVQVELPLEEQLFPREYSPNASTMLSVRNNNLMLFVTGINILRCTIIAQYTKTTDTATT